MSELQVHVRNKYICFIVNKRPSVKEINQNFQFINVIIFSLFTIRQVCLQLVE